MALRFIRLRHVTQCNAKNINVPTLIVACKRLGMFVCFASFCLLALLYCAQPIAPLPSVAMVEPVQIALKEVKQLNDKTAVTDKPFDASPEWTWVCVTGVCHRTPASTTFTQQSLTTCNMICSNVTLIWPKPTGSVKWSNNTPLAVKSEDFTLMITKSSSEIVETTIQKAFELMRKDLHDLERNTGGNSINVNEESHKVTVRVEVTGDPDIKLRLDTDESYRLKLRFKESNVVVSIRAHSFCGARHGFETLSQLIWFDFYAGSLLILQGATVRDRPKFKYRGLLLDTARNFFPVPDILRTIDAMAASKLNTFHWHATDSQSFPLKLDSVPALSKFGAYDPKSVYTRDDIKAVVNRARLRGIRVVIEIDTPAHVTKSWVHTFSKINSKAEVAFPCQAPPSAYQLNPLNEDVYYMLEKIYAEIIELTEVTDVFHLGGDEVDEECWFDHIDNAKPMQLWLDFTLDIHQALTRANNGKAPNLTLIWSSGLVKVDRFDELDPKRFGIQVWGSSEWLDMIAISKGGFRTIASHVNAWYLDCGLGSWMNDPAGACSPYKTWQVVYNHRPWSHKRWLVEGGEVCQWSELLSPSGLDTSLWPRASAAAERLWSDPRSEARDKESFRMDVHRQRLVDRGVGAAPVWPRWCSHNPYKCINVERPFDSKSVDLFSQE